MTADTVVGDADATYAAADVKVDAYFDLPRQHPAPMELIGSVVEWSGDKLTIWEGTQNANAVRFSLRAEVNPPSFSDPAALDDAVKALLRTAEPGDLIIVRHPGGGVADGGHCRVVIDNDIDGTGIVKCAQASHDSGRVRDETLDHFTGEDCLWVLRPTQKRPEGPARIP